MHFSHHPAIWQQYPELAAAALYLTGIRPDVPVETQVERFQALARERLAAVASESELPEIQAWRRVFSRMGLKPTQYRCASESLLRRFRIEGVMPRLHPLVDLCNSVSMAFATPVAALDVGQLAQWLQVRHAAGDESYQTFGGDIEHPEAGEVSFIDAQNRAHARRWTNRQSGLSAVREPTEHVLIVVEAVHADAAADVARIVSALAQALNEVWEAAPSSALLSAAAPRFEFAG